MKTLERPRVQIGSLFPARVTIEAGLGRVALVCLFVDFQENELGEAGGTVLTLEGLVLAMRLFVLDQVELLVETGRAKGTGEQFVVRFRYQRRRRDNGGR